MSTDIVSKNQFTADQMDLITRTIAKGATPDELKLFLYRCENLGLDPLKPGQIYFVKYGSSPGTIVVGIEGFRSRAARTGKLSGIKRAAIRNNKGELIGAYAEVFRSDWRECAREEVPLKEYDTGKNNWAKMPETMIKKVAEAAALRMAFPDDLGGIYVNEEMDQAEKSRGQVLPQQPMEEDGIRAPLPSCDCGTTLKFTSKKSGQYPDGCWFCPDWAAKDKKHIRPMLQSEYDGFKQELIHHEIEKRGRAEQDSAPNQE